MLAQRLHLVAGLLFVCSLAACAGLGLSRSSYDSEATPEMAQEYRRAELYYQRGRFSEALPFLKTYIDQHPYHRLTDRARLRVGQIYLRTGRPGEAIPWLDKVTRGVYDTELTPEALYQKMIALQRIGKLNEAWKSVRAVRWSATRAKHRILIASLGVELGRHLKQTEEALAPLYLEVLDAYVTLPRRLEAEESWVLGQSQARGWIRSWADAKGGERNTLKSLAQRFSGKNSGGYVLYKWGKLAYEAGKAKEAQEVLDRFVRGYPNHEYVPQARTILNELGKKVGEEAIVSIGVVLPLSGRYGSYGKAVLSGIECSAGIYGPCQSKMPVRLVVRDSAGDPEQAAKAFAEIITDESVVGVVGPLAQVEVDTIAQAAEDHKVPTITLTQKPDITQVGSYVFRNFLTVADQVQTLARHVCNKTELRKIAILYPSSSVGALYKEKFTEELAQCNALVQTAVGYDPNTVNFQEVIRSLKFAVSKHALNNQLGFEALFIPDSYKNLSQIVPLLSFLKVDQAQLLGAAGWNNDRLIREYPDVMEGALFVGDFYPQSNQMSTRRFAQTFETAFSRSPTFLEAYGYDSLELFQRAIRSRTGLSREAVQGELLKVKGFEGATGAIDFDSSGDAKRHLFVLTVKDGQIQEAK